MTRHGIDARPTGAGVNDRPGWAARGSDAALVALDRLRQAIPRPIRFVLVEILAVGVPALAAIWGFPPRSWSLAAALVACVLLPLRHLRPEPAVIAALPALAGGLGWPVMVVALYRLGRCAPRRSSTILWLTVVAVGFGTVFLTEQLPWQMLALTLAYVGLMSGAPLLLGQLMTTRDRLTTSLRELEQARESALAASRDAARAQERARIGREIHDAVGHHATLIAVSAAALSMATQEEQTRQSAKQIREWAKVALAEMRAALGLSDAAQVAGSSEVQALVAGARSAGVVVALEVTGTPTMLPPVVDRAVYRVVQESLTNAARHAPGAPVTVQMRWGGAALDVAIRNPVTGASPEPGSGTGLAGLTERVTLLGGRLTAEREASQFVVSAQFPLVAGNPAHPLQPLVARHPA